MHSSLAIVYVCLLHHSISDVHDCLGDAVDLLAGLPELITVLAHNAPLVAFRRLVLSNASVFDWFMHGNMTAHRPLTALRPLSLLFPFIQPGAMAMGSTSVAGLF